MGSASLKVMSPQLQRNEGGGTQRGVGTAKIPMALGDSLGKVRRWKVTGRIRGPKLLFQNMHSLYLKHIYVEEESGSGGHSS